MGMTMRRLRLTSLAIVVGLFVLGTAHCDPPVVEVPPQPPPEVGINVTIASVEIRNGSALPMLLEATVSVGLGTKINAPPIAKGTGFAEVGTGGWTFLHTVDPANESEGEPPARKTYFYPIRISVEAIMPVVGKVPLDIDPTSCKGDVFGGGCAQMSTNRPPTDEFGLDLDIDLATGAWHGDQADGQAGEPPVGGKPECVWGNQERATRICFSITGSFGKKWERPRSILVSSFEDGNGECDSSCSLREALLLAQPEPPQNASPEDIDKLAIPTQIVLPEGTHKLTLKTEEGARAGATGQLFIKQPRIEITGRGSVVIQQSAENTRVIEVGEKGSLYMSNLSITGGTASDKPPSAASPGHVHGGGIHNHGRLRLENVTITNNHAALPGDTPATRGGGGLYNAEYARLKNVTIADNSAKELGAGLSGSSSSSSVTWLENTLLVNNEGGSGNCTPLLGIINGGGNVQFPGVFCRPTIPMAAIDPVGPMQPSFTYPLYPNSAAVDVTAFCGGLDQLGSPRPTASIPGRSPMCDSGAIEFIPRS